MVDYVESPSVDPSGKTVAVGEGGGVKEGTGKSNGVTTLRADQENFQNVLKGGFQGNDSELPVASVRVTTAQVQTLDSFGADQKARAPAKVEDEMASALTPVKSEEEGRQASQPPNASSEASTDLLTSKSGALSIFPVGPDPVSTVTMDSLVPEKGDGDYRPPTPLKDDPLAKHEQDAALAAPPPPPPPKDVPPKDVPPKDVPPKDVPPKDVPPKDRARLGPSVTPRPSRPGSKSASPSRRGSSHQGGSSASSSEDEAGDSTRSEIHNIFEQSSAPTSTEHPHPSSSASPALAEAMIGARHPPRTSSLDGTDYLVRASSGTPSLSEKGKSALKEPDSHTAHVPTVHQPPPPDEDLPFDFHRFLSQLRHRSADPVAKFLRSFLNEFAKKQWMVHEQVKIVSDFLDFIYGKMETCEVWLNVGEVEMDNAREGMEKLVMNRLYTQTFSPEIPPPQANPAVGARRYRRDRDEKFPGRRGQHQEDVERDEVLAQKVRIYGWVREEHLDIQDAVTEESGRKFLDLAVNEMTKMGSYRAPRDKVICVLNCCKVIFGEFIRKLFGGVEMLIGGLGLLRHSGGDESADKFVPLLIYVVLKANPANLVSNVQYILRFRNPDKLNGEAGYYLSSLMGAIQFIEGLDRSSLTITDEEFESNVEAAVAQIAERPSPTTSAGASRGDGNEIVNEKGNCSGPLITPRASSEQPRLSTSSRESNDSSTSNGDDEKLAVAGLLRSIQRPLTTIGRMFTDEPAASNTTAAAGRPALTPAPGNTPRGSPGAEGSLITAVGGRRKREDKLTAAEAAARQAEAEAEQARIIQRSEHESVVQVLQNMFPDLDKEIIADVVRMKEGRLVLFFAGGVIEDLRKARLTIGQRWVSG
ncbi:unnamed protein product [Tuber aestivum]|uniref:VPS9 domain-containing protein n=1 Tax=Tuber aestivum TaxID=59557 RepID=A0A292Q4W2_9PEZI|nr:unnamed protein product [Tuber aestivum]